MCGNLWEFWGRDISQDRGFLVFVSEDGKGNMGKRDGEKCQVMVHLYYLYVDIFVHHGDKGTQGVWSKSDQIRWKMFPVLGKCDC